MTEVSRFRNGAVTLPDGLYWDILGLYQDIVAGLRAAARIDPDDQRASRSTPGRWTTAWSTPNGALIGNPRHYRDPRNAAVIDAVHATVPAGEALRDQRSAVSAVQHAVPVRRGYPGARAGVQALLIPDLLGYWLTGERVTEDTNASTTGLVEARTGQWSTDLLDTLGIPGSLLPRLVPPGHGGRGTDAGRCGPRPA